jgi:myo-inositol-1(or 4)-monophosphatase
VASDLPAAESNALRYVEHRPIRPAAWPLRYDAARRARHCQCLSEVTLDPDCRRDSPVTDHRRLFEQADAVVRRVAEALVAMQHGPLNARKKELLDVVTDADLAAERMLIDGLRDLTPGASIFSEEAGASGSYDSRCWFIDPLDGTVNYASGLPWFSVTVAYQEQGRTLLGLTHAPAAGLIARYLEGEIATVDERPARVSQTSTLADAVVSVVLTSHFSPDDVQRAAAIVGRLGGLTRGVRIVVSGALEMSLVAAGRLDAFVGIKTDVVSHAATLPLVRAAGGRVSTLSGADATDSDLQKVASNSRIHDELLAQLTQA